MKNRITGLAVANPMRLAILAVLGGLFLAACTALETDETTIWYVATTGDDENTCTETSSPCLTIAEAYGRANDDDQIIIAAGTYSEVTRFEGQYVFSHIGFDLLVTGAGQGETIIDLGNMYGGFYVDGAGHLLLTDLTVQNAGGYIAGGCVNLINIAIAELKNVTLTDCLTSGIYNGGTSRVELINVSVTRSRSTSRGGDGTGVSNTGIASIQGGEISGNAANGVFNTGTLEMDGTVILNNAYEGIDNVGEATLANLTIQDNGGTMGHLAGIEIAGGSTTLMDSLVSANHSYGVEVLGEATRVVIQNTTISDHIYSGIRVDDGTLTLDEVTIQNNGSDVYAGLQVNNGLVEIRGSHITQNHHGGIFNRPDGEVNIFETVIDENEGDSFGAFFNEGTANISASLISNNVGGAAAAIENRGDMTIINSTVSGNENLGIAIFSGNLSLSYVTIAENERGGISVSRRIENLMFTNILVAKNIGGDCNITNPDIPDPILAGVNIATSPSCAFPSTYTSDVIMLAELADNGGPTLTHALLTGSPAIDAASSSCPAGDQRLVARPAGPACDVGAYEAGAVAASLEITPTPDSEIIVTVIQDARCRVGPDFIYPDYDFFEPGQTTTVLGRSADSNWYYVQALSFSGKCFIGKAVLQFDVAPEILLALPVIQPPATPTPTLDPDESYDVTETPESPKPTACPTLINKPGSCK